MTIRCAVPNCRVYSHDRNYRMFSFPRVKPSLVGTARKNAETRLRRWISAASVLKTKIKAPRICSTHFFSGAPALQEDLDDVDWVPTRNLNLPPRVRNCASMEEPDRSEAASSEAVPSDDEANQMEPEEDDTVSGCVQEEEEEGDEYIGVDPQEVRDSNEYSSDFHGFSDLLSSEMVIKEEEIEIKEEEIQLDSDTIPEGDDPIGGVEATSDTSTDTAEEAESEPASKQRKLTRNVLVRVQKTYRPIIPKAGNIPHFVPGLMANRNSNLLCLECGHCFSSAVNFASHRKHFHVQLPDFLHSCTYCKRKFKSRVDLQRHLLHHTRLETLRCSVCHLVMNSANSLADHLADHRESCARHRCNLCGTEFSSADQLESHNVKLHSKIPKISKVVMHKDLICFVCGKTEQTSTKLHHHIRLHKGAVKCAFCKSSQINVDKLAIHVAKFHNSHRTITYDYCTNCNEIFFSQQQMITHKPNCVLPKSLQSRFRLECHICNVSYFDEKHYETHMRLHAALSQEVVRKPCQLCSFFAKNTSEHAIHMTTVHGFRDTVESMEKDFDNIPGVKCVVAKCQRKPRPPGQIFHYLPDARAQPEQWNRLLQVFGLPWNFKPKPTYRMCSTHFMGFNAANAAGK